ncbi:MAG TPA: 2-dehydropantoate 2-reductase N-terminal domain-containing protein [Dehalococcoidia bacterium]|nr:2-dehydropantoate 2-reductase N-terminal domain-containing protein [Dehalococcoidia bacterium]
MRYVIYGAGGIGGVMAAKLHMHGIEVAVIARGAHLQAIQKDGLRLRYPVAEEPVALPIPAYGNPSEIEFRDDDVVIMTMKSQDTFAALNDLSNAAGDRVPVVNCQNGVENERMTLRLFSRVYGMVIFMPGAHLEPGLVETSAWPVTGVLDLGRYPSGNDLLAEAIAADLRSADFLSEARPDIMRLKYTKLLQNMLNAVQAVCGLKDADDLVAKLRREAEACYRAAGINWAPNSAIDDRAAGLSRNRVHGWPGGSTLQSLLRGAGSVEVDYLNGEIVMLGRLHGVPTPGNEVFQAFANRMARQRLAPGSYSVEEMRRHVAEREAAVVPGSAK